MSWETRRGRGQYYTRSRRVNGRVTREYCGSGVRALLMAMEDEMRRQELLAQKQRIASYRLYFSRLEEQHKLLDKCLGEITSRFFLRAGYHPHGRSWRRLRKKQEHTSMQTKEQTAHDNDADILASDELITRARKGDMTCLKELDKRFDDNPELWKHYSDLFNIVLEHSLDKTAGSNLLTKEALKRKVKAWLLEWAGGGSSLEMASAERLALMNMETYIADLFVIEARHKQGNNYVLLQHLEKLHSIAQQRLSNAMIKHTQLCQMVSRLRLVNSAQQKSIAQKPSKKVRSIAKKATKRLVDQIRNPYPPQAKEQQDLDQQLAILKDRLTSLIPNN